MKKTVMTMDEAKTSVSSLVGKSLKIAVNKGRKKIVKYDAVIGAVFPCVFTLKIHGNHPVNTLSFSYSDVICGNVRLKENTTSKNAPAKRLQTRSLF